jgi:hypothetical protein
MNHRVDAYCPACGGTCRDAEAIRKHNADAGWYRRKLDVRPTFTGAGSTSFKPTRKPGRFE